MRSVVCLSFLLLLLVSPGGAAPVPADAVVVRYDLSSGEILFGPLPDPEHLAADTCTTAGPVVLECEGVWGTHAAVEPPGAYLQAFLFPRALVSVEGGAFEMWIQWESDLAGLRCTIPATTSGPLAAVDFVCEELGAVPSYSWLRESWTLHLRQDASVAGSIQATVVFDGVV